MAVFEREKFLGKEYCVYCESSHKKKTLVEKDGELYHPACLTQKRRLEIYWELPKPSSYYKKPLPSRVPGSCYELPQHQMGDDMRLLIKEVNRRMQEECQLS